MTVTSKLHTQEYRDIELNIVIDEIGPGEGLLDSGGIEIPLKPAGKGGVAQFPAGSPVQATTCGQSAPMTEVACEDEDWERVVRSPPPDRSDPSSAMSPMEPVRAPVLRVPRPAPPRAVLTGVTTQVGHFPHNHPPVIVFAGPEEEGARPVRRHNQNIGVRPSVAQVLVESAVVRVGVTRWTWLEAQAHVA